MTQSIDRDLQHALSAFSAAESADDLDRAYVNLVPPLEQYPQAHSPQRRHRMKAPRRFRAAFPIALAWWLINLIVGLRRL